MGKKGRVYTDAFLCDFNNQPARYLQTSAEICESVKEKKKKKIMTCFGIKDVQQASNGQRG